MWQNVPVIKNSILCDEMFLMIKGVFFVTKGSLMMQKKSTFYDEELLMIKEVFFVKGFLNDKKRIFLLMKGFL